MRQVRELSTLETLIDVASEPAQRPLDFALILQLRNSPDIQSLKIGAQSARTLFPRTNSFIRNNQWIPSQLADASVTVLQEDVDEDSSEQIKAFLDRPLDPKEQVPVQQLLIVNERARQTKLVTRFHHVVADGLSAAMWLGHQLRVAYGLESQPSVALQRQELVLRSHSSPVRKSEFAFGGAACPLWLRSNRRSNKRRWATFDFNAGRLRERCRRARGFTYNDLLVTCLLEVFVKWNSEHGRKRNVSLWLPVNIRKKPLAGFGNGTSRIRVYARYDDSLSIADKCREIRKQIAWSIRHGEWAIPNDLPFERWPAWVARPIIRGYLNRPRVDMGTAVFSHLERLDRSDELVFQNVERVECVGLLHKQHSLALNGSTQRSRTWLTFTYDPSLLFATDIDRLIEIYKDQLARAIRELR
jgi:hypothetical protein